MREKASHLKSHPKLIVVKTNKTQNTGKAHLCRSVPAQSSIEPSAHLERLPLSVPTEPRPQKGATYDLLTFLIGKPQNLQYKRKEGAVKLVVWDKHRGKRGRE